jgi:PIN domain nuclease of toxin-antitoxin system
VRYILDTSTFLFFAQAPERLSSRAKSLVSDTSTDLVLSAASALEIAIKQSIGKFDPKFNAVKAARDYGFTWLPLTVQIYDVLRELPLHHRDPFDRLIISQAIDGGYAIIGSDRHFAAYAVPVVW